MESLSPFPWGSCIPYNMPVYPGALRIAGDTGVLSLKVDAVADYRIVAADRGGYGEGQDGGLHALIRV